MTRIVRGIAVVAVGLALALGWLWALAAIWYFGHWPLWVRIPLAAVWAVAFPVAAMLLSRPRAFAVVATGSLAIWLGWFCQRPSNERPWEPDQERMPRVTFRGDSITVRNLRHASYRTADDYDVEWLDRSYDLSTLRTVEFVVEPFADWRGPAHTFLTFGFSDGRYVAISIEIRKERGESFSPLAGIFRQYEIAYVVGDERDLIGLRVDVRRNPVYLFPIRASGEQIRNLFVAMLGRANRLAEQPEFYNTLTNSCTSNIIGHMEQLTGEALPPDWRKLLPGYTDEFALELGLIDSDGDLEEIRDRFLVPATRTPAKDGRDWSRRIRSARP